MRQLWLRLGVELSVSESELQEIVSGECANERLLELVLSNRSKIVGDSYFPEITQNEGVEGLEWDFSETPLTQFFVSTPDGTLRAYQTGDIDYPGVAVDLAADSKDKPDISLSLTEYIPGGEGISDYNPADLDAMDRQDEEVPVERRKTGEDGHQEVSAGFVTRGWPNEVDDPENHKRIFHYGYSQPLPVETEEEGGNR